MTMQSYIPEANEFQVLKTIASNAASSGLYAGVGSEQKILMILLAAKELGIPPMTALNGGLWNIQGKIEISARMINSMLRKAGITISIKRLDSKGCILEGKRPDTGDSCVAQFLEEDAARAGVLSRTPWKNNPEDMYFARAVSKLGRRLAPDLLGTAYVEGEIRGEIECSPKEVVQESEEELYLEDLLKEYPEEDHKLITLYFEKYSEFYKKTISQSLKDYADREKFNIDLAKFRAKQ